MYINLDIEILVANAMIELHDNKILEEISLECIINYGKEIAKAYKNMSKDTLVLNISALNIKDSFYSVKNNYNKIILYNNNKMSYKEIYSKYREPLSNYLLMSIKNNKAIECLGMN